QPTDLVGHFQRQTARLIEHQTHIRGIWDQDFEVHQQQQPPQQDTSDEEMDREIDAAFDFFTAPGGSSSQGGL
ncbi:hypothetical protein A2U01_0098612, partial [Trifolium medium]|nr:hypothetical protein [Trifolium medium]